MRIARIEMLEIVLVSCFVALAISTEPFVPSTDYCEIDNCIRGPHIACGNDGKFGYNCTIDAKLIQMTKELKDQIILRLNGWRNQIAHGGFHGLGPAARMATVRWDDELAYLAEFNARQCLMHQDACRNTKRYPMAGQTVAYIGYIGRTPKVRDIVLEQLRLWFNEYIHVTMEDIITYQLAHSEITTNFAQMMRDISDAVGCAVVSQTYNDWFQFFLVCNYAVITIIGTHVYESAANATVGCKTGGNPYYPSLCSLDEPYNGALRTPQAAPDDKTDEEDNKDKGTAFDNFLQQLARHSTKTRNMNITVETYGHHHVNRNLVNSHHTKRTKKLRSKAKKHH